MMTTDVKYPQWLPKWLRPAPLDLKRARTFTEEFFADRLESVHRIPGWLHPDQAAMLCHLARICPDGPIVEIGSFKGKSTVFLAVAKKETNSLTSIDPHILTVSGDKRDREAECTSEKTSWDAFNGTLNDWNIEDEVSVVRDFSYNVSGQWSDPIAFLWIDGDHRYEGVVRDIGDWVEKVQPGGFVGFHDTHPNHAGHGGPRRAILEAGCLAPRGFETYLELRNAWFFRRSGLPGQEV